MWLIRAALRRPISILVAVIAVALTAVFAVSRMRADIFPDLDLPVIYVAQPYGGMSPAQMEGYITYYYADHFLYVNGIESVESKSIQNTSLLKLTFHAGTEWRRHSRRPSATSIARVPSCRPGPSARSSCASTPGPCRSATWCSPVTAAASVRFRTSR